VRGSLKETPRFDNSPLLQEKGIPEKSEVERAMVEGLLHLVSQFKGFG